MSFILLGKSQSSEKERREKKKKINYGSCRLSKTRQNIQKPHLTGPFISQMSGQWV